MKRLVDDGSFFVARTRNPPRFAYPFANFTTPDNFTRIISRGMVVRPQNFQPITAERTAWKNWLLQSNTLNAAAWALTRATVETNGTQTPDKAVAWRLVEDSTSADTHYIEQAGIAISAGKVVRYVIAKAGQRSRINLAMTGDVSVAMGFDLIQGTTYANGLGMAAPEDYAMFPLGGGWFFCGMKQTFTAGVGVFTYLDDGSGVTYDGDGASGVYLAYDHVLNSPVYGPIFPSFGEPRTISAPELDPGDEVRDYDPFSFLIEEPDPQPDQVGRYVWDRNYSRIPLTQVVPGSLMISKPDISGTFPQNLGIYKVFQPDTTLKSYDAFTRLTVTEDTGIPNFSPDGGTYTLTFDGDTTAAIDFDASAGTVQTELNALASVTDRGGLTVIGSYNDPNGFIIVFNSYALATVTSSLTPGSFGFTSSQSLNNGYQQDLHSARSTPVTGGTFTITIFGQTTAAINWDDDEAAMETAINALSEVAARGGVTVSFPWGTFASNAPDQGGYYYHAQLIMSFTNPAMTADASALTPTGSSITTTGNTPYLYSLVTRFSGGVAYRTLVIPGHSFSIVDQLFIKGDGDDYYVAGGSATIVDENTITLAITADLPYANVTAITEAGRRTRAAYTPGATTVPVTKTTTFYFPGITPGVNSASDIPTPVNQSSNDSFLQAIFFGSGTINWQVGDIAQWKGPILSLTVTTMTPASVQ